MIKIQADIVNCKIIMDFKFWKLPLINSEIHYWF